MPPKKSKDGKRQRSVNWSQDETELLADLVLQYGKKGILCKETNAATNKTKEDDWAKIEEVFNATDSVSIYLISFF